MDLQNTHTTNKTKSIAKVFIILGIIGILATGLLGFRISHRLKNRPPLTRQTDVTTVREWMTLTYVSRVYGVPQPELEVMLNLKPDDYRKTDLATIAQKNKVDLDRFINNVKSAITQFQNTHPTPPPR